jgi:undecaprenyl-diphosphatase
VSRRRLAACAGIVFVVAAIAFASLAVAVAARVGPLGPDAHLLHDVVSWRSGGLNLLARVLTKLGTDVVIYPLLIVAALLCAWRRERPMAGLLTFLILIAGQLVRVAINRTIGRPRPPSMLHLVGASGYAFPSGHTTNATIAYALAAVLLAATFPRWRWVFAAGAAILAVGVGLSRVYLAVHWATDVAGGWLFGIAWLALSAVVVAVIPAFARRGRVFS